MKTAMSICPHADEGWHIILVRVTDDRKDSVGLTIEETIAKNTEELHNAADVEATRQALIEFIFGTTKLPATLPESTDGGMLVRLPNGFTSFITVSVPDMPNAALVIYHTGHEGFTNRDQAAIRACLAAGYTVWRLYMPLLGANPPVVTVNIPEAGEVTIHQHRQMAYWDEITTEHPLRYFVEPVIAAVNQADVDEFTDIFMTGLSGGGVSLSLHRAGPQRNWGDWEENLPELFRIARFEDLSILGAARRSQIQVLNEYL